MDIYVAEVIYDYEGIIDYALFSTEYLAEQWLQRTYGEPSMCEEHHVTKHTVDSFPPIWYERNP